MHVFSVLDVLIGDRVIGNFFVCIRRINSLYFEYMLMSKERVQEIELRAKDVLLNAYDVDQSVAPPIDISRVVRALGLTIKEGRFQDENVVGAYDKASKTIFISDKDPYTRKAFTMAHELGHFTLHKDKQQETFFRSNTILLAEEHHLIEQEANCFAACLLMPKDLIVQYVKVVRSVERLAEIFGVSSTAMSWRLKNLGLLE